tara:strand:- start:1247 stop:1825 length:579 start_codon:yes stop_codon:yes gene_type:complete
LIITKQNVDKIIFGLGNPGLDYAESRHNLGFKFIDLISKKYSILLNDKGRIVSSGEGDIKSNRILLVKPQTYVNNSGIAMKRILDLYCLNISELIVVYDDMDLSPGKIRFRAQGSSGGHNGIKSIIDSCKTDKFDRLRLGIGRPGKGNDIDYVLGEPEGQDLCEINSSLEYAVEALEFYLDNEILVTMDRYN